MLLQNKTSTGWENRALSRRWKRNCKVWGHRSCPKDPLQQEASVNCLSGSNPPSTLRTNALQPSEHFAFISGSNTSLSHTKSRSQPSSLGPHPHSNCTALHLYQGMPGAHTCWFSLVLTFLMKFFFPLAYFISNTFYFTVSLLVNRFKSFVQWNVQIHVKTHISEPPHRLEHNVRCTTVRRAEFCGHSQACKRWLCPPYTLVSLSLAQGCTHVPVFPVCVCVSCSFVSDPLRPTDCSPPGSSAHGILQARILERVAILFPRPRGLNLALLHCRQIPYCVSRADSVPG